MDVGTLMLACFVIAAICGLLMYYIVKRKNELFNTAIAAEDIDAEAIAKASTYKKGPFIIALIVGIIATGTLFILMLEFAFGHWFR